MTKENLGNPKLTDEQKKAIQLSIYRGDGGVAFYAKKSIFDNPHQVNTPESEAWNDGYIAAEKRQYR